MINYLLLIIYIVFSATGLLLIKVGSNDFSMRLNSGLLSLSINMIMLLGMVFYVCSFFLFIFILPRFNLTYIYPLAAGILYIVITFAGVFFFKETLTFWHLVGMFFILLGVIAININ